MQATYSPAAAASPVRLEGHLEHPSRALWLIKWLVVIPHYFLLAFLWVAFFVSTVLAFVAVLFTGRYPRSLFDFNVGVLRWSWRVSTRPVFVGIGPSSAVDAYLANVAHAQSDRFDARGSDFTTFPGGAPASPPTAQRFWGARSVGTGQQTLTWSPQPGNWRIVMMKPDGSAAVSGDVSVGARVPDLLTIGIALLGGGILLLLISGGAIYLTVNRTR